MAPFEAFSAGYYLGRLTLAPHDGPHALMARAEHERANAQVYATGEGVERVDHPLVMKVAERHFPVLGADDVPADTVAVPDELLAAAGVEAPPTVREVLVARADRARQLLDWWTPYAVQEPDHA